MSRSPDSSYDELADDLTPGAVSQYLAAAERWRLDSGGGEDIEMWSLLGDDGEALGQILLPLATDFADFRTRFSEALRAIGIINDWSAEEVARRIARTRTDILLIRLDQSSPDETIPLRQAEATLDAIHQMMKHAAITAAAGGPVQRRYPGGNVSSYLDENIRLGHTRRGSYILTVLSRIVDAPDDDLLSYSAHVANFYFPRAVMVTLAYGLETTRDVTQERRQEAIDEPSRWGLSAGLIESIQAIAAPDDVRSVTFQFEWATTGPAPEVGRGPIEFEHATVTSLRHLHERLVRKEEPEHRATLFGLVISLARDDDSALRGAGGLVVISTEVGGRKRNVHMLLTDADHVRAIRSYQSMKPLIVTGDLVFERRAWWLIGDIEVDARLVE